MKAAAARGELGSCGGGGQVLTIGTTDRISCSRRRVLFMSLPDADGEHSKMNVILHLTAVP